MNASASPQHPDGPVPMTDERAEGASAVSVGRQPGGVAITEMLGHIAAVAALATQVPVVCLAVTLTDGMRVQVQHGPTFTLGAAGDSPRLEDGSRLVFRLAEPVVERGGVTIGELTFYDLLGRSLTPPQRQIVSRLARQAADLAASFFPASPLWDRPAAPETPPALEQLLDTLAEGTIHVDAQFNLRRVNRAAREWLGFTGEPAVNLWDLLPEAIGGPFHAACVGAVSSGTPQTAEDWFPIRNRQAETRVQPLDGGLLLVVRDVSQQRQIEAFLQSTQSQLRALSQKLRNAQEDERRRISRELHDVVGQDLSVIKLRLEMLRKRLQKGRSSAAHVTLCQDIIHDTENALAAARRLATEMRPSILDQLGLNAAVRWQAQEIERRTGIECRVQTDATDVRQGQGRDTAAFRALQELLTNVLRHSDARHVDIALTETDGELCLEVSDDGRGFPVPTDSENQPAALGLLGVRERVGAFGGHVEIQSNASQGTRVRITLPHPPPEPIE